ncbi:unnamed protein product [Rotaria socialis]|uniref:Uncharacterized protein n=1 Tax=Rotaria socialis TaxID=392032 RepID=A0A821AE74_9BILA|nr:unnamed protein product [Rotaria socialis]
MVELLDVHPVSRVNEQRRDRQDKLVRIEISICSGIFSRTSGSRHVNDEPIRYNENKSRFLDGSDTGYERICCLLLFKSCRHVFMYVSSCDELMVIFNGRFDELRGSGNR